MLKQPHSLQKGKEKKQRLNFQKKQLEIRWKVKSSKIPGVDKFTKTAAKEVAAKTIDKAADIAKEKVKQLEKKK